MTMSLSHSAYRPIQNDITVWVVEDHDEFRQTVQDLIDSRAGMQCPEAFASCEDLFAALRTEFAPEVVLMDIELPGGMSGIEGVQQLKAISPATHVIMLTIHEDNDRIFNAVCAGASGYLLKTSSTDKIFEAVEEACKGGVVMTAQIARRVLNMFTQRNAPRRDYGLTEREKEVLQHLVEGKTKKEIAEVLYRSYHTIDTHMRNIYAKLHVPSRTDAAVKAVREGLV